MVIQRNFIVSNASGDTLNNISDLNIYKGNARNPDKNYLSVKVLADGDNVIGKIEKFLDGDLSTITLDYDLVYNESGELYKHMVQEYKEFTLNPVINRFIPSAENKNLHYVITIFQQDNEYKEALKNNADLLDMHEAIASMYETMDIKEEE